MSYPAMNTAVKRALKRRDASVIGVGQGAISPHTAFPRQMEAAQFVHLLGRPHKIMRTVDSDGERGVIVVPKLGDQFAVDLGNRYRQRSVINGGKEIQTSTAFVLTEFDDVKVWSLEDRGFLHVPPHGRGLTSLSFKRIPARAGRSGATRLAGEGRCSDGTEAPILPHRTSRSPSAL